MDQRCVLGLRQKARGSRLLGLRAGRHGQRSEDEYLAWFTPSGSFELKRYAQPAEGRIVAA